jgi:hypothetical protein
MNIIDPSLSFPAIEGMLQGLDRPCAAIYKSADLGIM